MPIEDFYIKDPVIDRGLGSSNLIRQFDLKPYDEKTIWRFASVRRGHHSEESWCLVTTRQRVFRVDQLTEQLIKQFPTAKSVICKYQPTRIPMPFLEKNGVHMVSYITDQMSRRKRQCGPSYTGSIPKWQKSSTQTAIDFAELSRGYRD